MQSKSTYDSITSAISELSEKHSLEDSTHEKEGIRTLLKTFHGRRFLWFLLAETGVYKNAFSQNALSTAHETGKQQIGQVLLQKIFSVDEHAYITMMQENLSIVAHRKEELNEIRSQDLE